jgi:hypothetical protein
MAASDKYEVRTKMFQMKVVDLICMCVIFFAKNIVTVRSGVPINWVLRKLLQCILKIQLENLINSISSDSFFFLRIISLEGYFEFTVSSNTDAKNVTTSGQTITL